LDWALEVIGLAALALFVVYPHYNFDSLPEIIPQHFNLAGAPDGHGPKSTLLGLPIIGVIVYVGLFVLGFFPQIYNYPVRLTPTNIEEQYRLATRLVRVLRVSSACVVVYLVVSVVQSARGSWQGLGIAFLPVAVLLMAGPLVYYIVRARRAA
jgi:uncharacterized membrane protein